MILSGGATDGFCFTSHVDVWLPPKALPEGLVLATAREPDGDPLPERWQHSAVSCVGALWLYGGQDRGRGPCGMLHMLTKGAGPRAKVVSESVPLVRCADDHLVSSVELPLCPGEDLCDRCVMDRWVD